MATVRPSSHDFKVFVRRLIVPGELGRDSNKILLPSQLAGLFPGDADDPAKKAEVNKALRQGDIKKLFEDYEPKQFRRDVLSKAEKVRADFQTALNSRRALLQNLQRQYDEAQQEIRAIKDKKSLSKALDKDTVELLSGNQIGQEFYARTKNDPILFAAGEEVFGTTQPTVAIPGGISVPIARTNLTTPTTPGKSPTERDIFTFSQTKTLIESILNNKTKTLVDTTVTTDRQGNPLLTPNTTDTGLTPLERNLLNQIRDALNLLMTSSPEPGTERDLRGLVAESLGSLLRFSSHGASATAKIGQLSDFSNQINQQMQVLQDELAIFDVSSNVRPFYDPILLSSTIGPQSVQTQGNRLGQPGTATVTFHLPLDGQGDVPDLFMGLRVDDIFSLSLLEGQSPSGGTRGQQAIPSQTMSILAPNKRETTLLPFDMIQVWGRKRTSTGSNFPGDYYPIFTGFITKTAVNYGGSTISVSVSGEDVGKSLRLARVNVDPNLDPRFRPTGINVTAFNNVLNSPQFKTGADLIEGLILGTPGTFLGMSQVEVLEKVEQKPEGGQTIPKFTTRARRVSLASDFDTIKLNLFQDLLNRWKPYATQFKNAFRLWETDARNKWDICREVADITEFEFYVDSLGVVNYHPPLYFLNPFAAQYFIEDVDIKSESHVVDESEVLTVVQVHSQPSIIPDTNQFNVGLRNDSLIAAPDPVIQRFGVRWQKKSVPIFSGTEFIKGGANDSQLRNRNRDAGRDGYARAWMNRRNANIKTSTVTINGTPEIRMCNTVAFVGDLQNTLKTVATNQMAAAASGLLGGASTALLSLRNLPPGAVAALKNVLVYYVTGISHNYVQGGSYDTTLTLTHGRRWTDPLPQGSVGYALDATDTDTVVQQIRAAFGQDGVDADAFAREVNNKIQFIASGNPAFLAPQSDSVFGLTARPPKPSAIERFRNTLSSEIRGAIERARSQFCRKLLLGNDPDQVEERAKSNSESVSKALSNLISDAKKGLANALNKVKTLAESITDPAKIAKLVSKAVSEQIKKPEKKLNELEEQALNALLGGKSFKILSETTTADVASIPESVLSPLKSAGANTDRLSRLANEVVGVVIFTYIAKSEDSFDQAVSSAGINLKARASDLLRPRNPGQLITVFNQALVTTTIKGSSKTRYFVQGAAIFAVKPSCP